MLLSSNAFTQNSTISLDVGNLTPPKEPLPLDIELPEPIELEQNGLNLYAWDMEGYAIILQIFNGYTLWADNYIAESEKDSLWQIRLDICEKNKGLEAANFQLAIDHRDRMYELWYENQRDVDRELRRGKLKTVLVSTGVGVVGVAAGLLAGFLLAQK